jgi:hypothetical protein
VSEESGLSRKEFLKRGAVLGGSLIWAAPAIQAIGMSAAFANETSPVCNVYFAAKIGQEGGSTGPVECLDISDQEPGPGKCLDVAGIASGAGFTVSEGACIRVDSWTNPEDGDWTVTLVEGCQLWDAAVGIKSSGGSDCVPAPTWEYDPTTRTITFDRPEQAISHVEFIFCCSS